MARNIEVCDNCGKEMCLGDEVYSLPKKDKLFCSVECMKEWIMDNIIDEVVEDWMEDNSECGDVEESDPYARYGVNRSDF